MSSSIFTRSCSPPSSVFPNTRRHRQFTIDPEPKTIVSPHGHRHRRPRELYAVNSQKSGTSSVTIAPAPI